MIHARTELWEVYKFPLQLGYHCDKLHLKGTVLLW